MAGYIGSIADYNEVEDFAVYEERFEQFVVANGITDADKKVAVFLTVIGPKAYGVLRSLAAPDKPNTKTYAVLVELLSGHYNPKPLVIVERFRFMKRYQIEGEGIQTYNAELKRLSTHCNFGTTLNERLRDQFIVGLHERNKPIQRHLLGQADLTYKRTIELATSMETAANDSRELTGAIKNEGPSSIRVHAVHKSSKSEIECYRCGAKDGHKANTCKFKDATCHACGKVGHLQRVCRGDKSRQKFKPKGKFKAKKVHHLDSGEADSVASPANRDDSQVHRVDSSEY